MSEPEQFTLEELLKDSVARKALVESLNVIDQKIEESVFSYRALVQFVNDGLMEGAEKMPNLDVLTFIIANRYAAAIAMWDGTMSLPLMLARITAKEMLRDQT